MIFYIDLFIFIRNASNKYEYEYLHTHRIQIQVGTLVPKQTCVQVLRCFFNRGYKYMYYNTYPNPTHCHPYYAFSFYIESILLADPLDFHKQIIAYPILNKIYFSK